MSLFAIILEGYAILSGFPYGYFTYSEKMGYKLFDLVPWTVPFAYVPLLLGIISIFGNRKSKTDLILVPILLVLADLIIDPGAVKLGLWAYIDTSFFYSVPLSNFLGWFLSGLVGYAIFNYSTILLKFRKSQAPVVINHKVAISLLLILIFWTSVDIWTGLIIPAFLGIFFVFYLCFLLSKRI